MQAGRAAGQPYASCLSFTAKPPALKQAHDITLRKRQQMENVEER